MSGDELSMCESCHQLTKTVAGKCANCWYPKRPELALDERQMWDSDDDLGTLAWLVVSWSPGLVALALGVIIDSTVLLWVGAALLIVRLLGSRFDGGWWWWR